MINIKIKDLLEVNTLVDGKKAIDHLNSCKTLDLASKLILLRNLKEISLAMELYNKDREAILKETMIRTTPTTYDYKKIKDASGKEVVDPKNVEEVNEKMNKLLDQSVDVNIIKLSVAKLPNEILTVSVMEKLLFMLDIDSATKEAPKK